MASRSLDDLEPDFRKLVDKLIDQAQLSGFPVVPICTFRSDEEQTEDWLKGRDKDGNIINPRAVVTHAKAGQSFHNYGAAVDLWFHDTVSGMTSAIGPWRDLGQIAEGCGLVWGGRWPGKKVDLDHFQVPGTIEDAKQRWLDHQKVKDSNGS